MCYGLTRPKTTSWRETSDPAKWDTALQRARPRDAPELAVEGQLLGEQLSKHLRLRLAGAEHPVELVRQALVANRDVQLHTNNARSNNTTLAVNQAGRERRPAIACLAPYLDAEAVLRGRRDRAYGPQRLQLLVDAPRHLHLELIVQNAHIGRKDPRKLLRRDRPVCSRAASPLDAIYSGISARRSPGRVVRTRRWPYRSGSK